MRDRTSSGVLIRWHYPMPALEIAILHSRFAGDAFDFFSRLVPPYAIWIYSSFQFHTSSICLLYSSCFGLRRVYTSFTSSRPSSFTEHRRSSTASYNHMSPLTFLVPSTIFVVFVAISYAPRFYLILYTPFGGLCCCSATRLHL